LDAIANNKNKNDFYSKEIPKLFYELTTNMKINLNFTAENITQYILKCLINPNIYIPLLKVQKNLKIKNLDLNNFLNEKFLEKLNNDINNEDNYYDFFTDYINDIIIDNRKNIFTEAKTKTNDFYKYLINEIPLFIKNKQQENRNFYVYGDFKIFDYLKNDNNKYEYENQYQNQNKHKYNSNKDIKETLKIEEDLEKNNTLNYYTNSTNNIYIKNEKKNIVNENQSNIQNVNGNNINFTFLNPIFSMKEINKKKEENILLLRKRYGDNNNFNLRKISSFRLERFNNNKEFQLE
jgi:hypothetical protein